MFLLAWLIVGVILMTVLIVKEARIAEIENALSRRYTLILVSATCFPAAVLLTLADHFIQFVDGDVDTIGQAFKDCFKEMTVGFYEDLKRAW